MSLRFGWCLSGQHANSRERDDPRPQCPGVLTEQQTYKGKRAECSCECHQREESTE